MNAMPRAHEERMRLVRDADVVIVGVGVSVVAIHWHLLLSAGFHPDSPHRPRANLRVTLRPQRLFFFPAEICF